MHSSREFAVALQAQEAGTKRNDSVGVTFNFICIPRVEMKLPLRIFPQNTPRPRELIKHIIDVANFADVMVYNLFSRVLQSIICICVNMIMLFV